jgi:hypothetical protein
VTLLETVHQVSGRYHLACWLALGREVPRERVEELVAVIMKRCVYILLSQLDITAE